MPAKIRLSDEVARMWANSKEFQQAVKAVEDSYNADAFVYSGPIDDEGFGKLAYSIAGYKSKANGLLILTTNGGQANAAYQIGRIFQRTYDEFILFTPSYCKSAGTIISLAANTLIMDMFSELGPLDVQLYTQDDIFVRKSGLLTRSAFESMAETSYDLFEHFMLRIKIASGNQVSFRKASELAAAATGALMSNVYSQMNPDVIGSDYRDLDVAREYGERLARVSGNPKPGSVDHLIRNYPSHDFIIDDEEAKTLFNKIDEPDASLYQLVSHIKSVIYKEAENHFIMALRGVVSAAKEAKEEQSDDEQTDNAESPKKRTRGSKKANGLDGSRQEDRNGDSREGETEQANPETPPTG